MGWPSPTASASHPTTRSSRLPTRARRRTILAFEIEDEKTLKGGKELVDMNKVWSTIGVLEQTMGSDGTGLSGRLKRALDGPGTGALPTTGGGSDGIRSDVDGNPWFSAGWVGDGFGGVQCYSPEGQLIGQIKLPEICSNLCFGGEKRNRLFVIASTSL